MLTPTDLQNDPRYKLLMNIPFKKLGSFVMAYYFKRQTWITLAHYAFVTVVLIAWLLSGIRENYSPIEWFIYYGWAVLLFLGLAAIHELIHLVAYRAFGAPQVKIKISWREATGYVIAPDFIIGSRDLGWVLVAPFLLISFALLVTLFVLPAYRYVQLGLIWLHTSGCAGDFAMLSFLWLHRKHLIFNYDDEESQTKYFYEQVE
jgi:hypothetical protein